MPKEIARVEGLSYSYEDRLVLKDITFSVQKGDYLGIIGPNGSGKTTLIKLMLGILKPAKGSIYLFGKPLSQFSEWHKLGYVPQKIQGLDQGFPATIEEMLSMEMLSKKRFPRLITSDDRKMIARCLKKVALDGSKRIGELSGGQQQRAFIAKSLVNKPELLILDEPTAGIDVQNQTGFYELLRELNKEKVTIIIISHDVGFITKYTTKVACLNQELVFHGTHAEFCSSDTVGSILGHDKHLICHDHRS